MIIDDGALVYRLRVRAQQMGSEDPGVQKARIYLNPGEKPPEGVQVEIGPRGGRYYEAGAGGAGRRDSGEKDDLAPIWNPDLTDDRYMVRRGGVTWLTSRTNIPTYDEELREGPYRYTRRFTWMDAKAYLDYQIRQLGLRPGDRSGLTPEERFYRMVDREKVERIKEAVRAGRPLPAFFLEFDSEGNLVDEQEGRHRILALIEMGVEKVPVWLFRQKATRGRTTPGDPPPAVEGEEIPDGGGVQKARVYLHPGEKPPEGVRVQTGPRGGRYYVTRHLEPGQQRLPARPPEKQPSPPEKPWQMKAPEPAQWTDEERRAFQEALLDPAFMSSNPPDVLESFAHLEGRAIGPGFYTLYRGQRAAVNPELVLGRTPDGRLRLMYWETYQDIRGKEYMRKPKPPLDPEVDRAINLNGARAWDEQRRAGELYGLEREACTLFTRDGKKIFSKVGEADRIEYTEEEVELMRHYEGRILTHTHPSGNSLSTQDFAFACLANLTEIRAVGDEYEYILLPPEGEGCFTQEIYDRCWGEVSGYDRAIYNEFWNRINAGEISIEWADRNHHHTLWFNVAKATGLRYIRRPRDPAQWEKKHLIHVRSDTEERND